MVKLLKTFTKKHTHKTTVRIKAGYFWSVELLDITCKFQLHLDFNYIFLQLLF